MIDFSNVAFVVLSIPHNPTGVIFDKKFLDGLYSKVRKNNTYLVIDHTYDIPFVGQSKNKIEHSYFFKKNIINIYSISKFGLASERIAFVIGEENVISKMKEQTIKNIIQSPKIGQLLAEKLIKYFSSNKSIVKKIANYYDERWEMLEFELQVFLNKNKNLDIKLLNRGGGPFFYFEIGGDFDVDILKKKCSEDGILLTVNSNLLPSYFKLKVHNGIRLGLGNTNRHVLKKALNKILENIVKINNK